MTKPPKLHSFRLRGSQIREVPYFELWEQNHRPDGRDYEFWHQAEKELNQGITPVEKSEKFLE